MKQISSIKLWTVAVILAAIGLASVGPAYAYFTSVGLGGPLNSGILTIDVTEGDTAVSEIVLVPDETEWISDTNTTTDRFSLNVVENDNGLANYAIVTDANSYAGSSNLYLYGYFLGGGPGIKTITLSLIGPDGEESTLKLYRSAYAENVCLTITDPDVGDDSWKVLITSYQADTYSGIPVIDGKIPVEVGGDNKLVSLADAYSVDDLLFHFCIRDNVLS